MSNEAKREYLSLMRERYGKAEKRAEKSLILTEVCLTCGYTRKHAIRLMRGKSGIRQRGPGARRKYPKSLQKPLKELWREMGQPCSKRMRDALPLWLEGFKKRHELSEKEEELLLQISPASIDRLLGSVRMRGMSLTQRPSSSWYQSTIPLRPKDWNIDEPGHIQADTVSHCGASAEGSFVSTLTMTDIETAWTEVRAVWTKRHGQMISALEDIEESLPFAIKSFKSDSGREFLNYGVYSYLRQTVSREKKIEFYRSRPYRKNDNCYVEQKNMTHVRELFGYERIENLACVEVMNRVYRDYWCPLQNYFMPTMKIIRKERIGSRIKKYYDRPKTPFQRLLNSKILSEEKEQKLKLKFKELDPFELREGMKKELKRFLALQRNNLLKKVA